MVEDVTGTPLRRYLADHVLGPLGMDDSDIARAARLTSRLATGYTLTRSGPRPITDRHGVTPAAGALYSTPRDMARYVAALLAEGTGEHGTVLEPATLALMFAPHWRPDPRIAGMGLAFWRVRLGGHPVVEHQGIVPGFNSQLLLAPDDGVGVLAFTNGSRAAGTWLLGQTQQVLATLLGVDAVALPADVPQRPDTWAELCGWYHPHAQRTDMMAWSVMGGGVEVRVSRGRLVLRSLSPLPPPWRSLPLHPDPDPDVFHLDLGVYGIGPARVVFGRDASGRVSALHFDGLLLSARKRQ